MSDSVQPHRRQPTRLPCPWDSPGKNTGVGCHFLLQCIKVKSESEVAQSCPTLSDPMDCSLPGSSVHGIFQARVLEWGAIALYTYMHIETKDIFIYIYKISALFEMWHDQIDHMRHFLHLLNLFFNWNYYGTVEEISLSTFAHKPDPCIILGIPLPFTYHIQVMAKSSTNHLLGIFQLCPFSHLHFNSQSMLLPFPSGLLQ